MSVPKIPYTVQAGMAVSLNNDEDVKAILQKGLQDISEAVMNQVIYKYDHLDIPLVMAAIRVTTNSLEELLSNEDKLIEKIIIEQTECVTIDASELQRQAKEEKDDGRKETC